MSNTRKVRRARKARDNALLERDQTNVMLSRERTRRENLNHQYELLREEWEYHVRFMQLVAPDPHCAMYRAKTIDIGPYGLPDRNEWNYPLTNQPNPSLTLKTIRASICRERGFYENELVYYIHLKYSHKEGDVYAYSDKVGHLFKDQKMAYHIIDHLWEKVRENFHKSYLSNEADPPKRIIEKGCQWVKDTVNDTEAYETGCGRSFVFIEGGVQENGINYCFGCGKPVHEIVQAP